MLMIFVAVSLWGFLAIKLWHSHHTSIQAWYWPGLLVRVLSGFVMISLYRYHYGAGDLLAYFSDGCLLSNLARTNFTAYLNFLTGQEYRLSLWQDLHFTAPRALLLSKCVSIVNLLTNDTLWLTSAYFSLFSFAGAWWFVRRLARVFPQARGAAVAAFLFFPSVVFWSSGLLKEGIAVPCIFYICALVLKVWQHKRLGYMAWLGLLFSTLLLWYLKYYYAGILICVVLPTLAIHYLLYLTKRSLHPGYAVLLWGLLFIGCVASASLLHPNFSIGYLPEVIIRNYQVYTSISEPGHTIQYGHLSGTPVSLVINTPWAIFSTLFRPFIWEATAPIQVVAGIENLFILCCVFMAIREIRRAAASPYLLLILGTCVYVLLMAAFLGLSAPNFGTLSRYRSGFLPFFVFLLLSNIPLARSLLGQAERLFLRLVRHSV